MSETLLVVANTPISVGLALAAFAAVLFLVLLTLVIVVARSAGARVSASGFSHQTGLPADATAVI